MVKFIIGAIIFGLIAIAIIVMVVINFTYRGVKKIRQEMEDNYYRNQNLKEQKEKKPFDDDYFKNSKGRRRQSRTEAQYEQREQTKRDKNPFGDDYFKSKQQEQPQEKKDTARKTTTSSGVTIIDDRDQERKIFDHSDGEYVEFEEV
jgi:peroxiredoxin family protein